jgi:hypothetical protein
MIVIQSGLGVSIEAWLDDSIPTISGNEAMFEEITRPKRKAAINWTGSNLLRMTVGCILDGFATGVSVEGDCTKLELLMVSRGGGGAPPQPVKILGPVPHKNTVWFVESIGWGAAIYEGLSRVRQQFTLNLVERLELSVSLPKARKPKIKFKWVILKKGEDLKDIAKRELGNPNAWTRLRQRNGKPFRGYGQPKGTKVGIPK